MSEPRFTAAALRGAVDLSALKRPAPRPGAAAGAGGAAGGAAGAPGTHPGEGGGLVVPATDATFQDVAAASMRWPLVVVLWSGRAPESASFVGVLGELARTNGGRFQVASIDVDANPGLLRAFQIQSVPSVLGLVQGQPVPLFVGVLPPSEIQPWIDELLKLAAQYGVTGQVPVPEAAPAASNDVEELPAYHQVAYDAIERGDLDAAVTAYEQALTEQPGDPDARLGLAQVRLLQRTEGADLTVARAAAAADPLDVPAQLPVADLDVLGGHVEDAFARLVDTVRATSGDLRNQARQHLLGLFEVVGTADPRVAAARRSLMSALF